VNDADHILKAEGTANRQVDLRCHCLWLPAADR
jgi:hypothetical protein